MGVAVLNPRDSLKTPSSQQALIFSSPKMKSPKPANFKPKPNQDNRNDKAKRSSKNNLYPIRPSEKPQVNKPVMGWPKILKIGELINTPDRASGAVKEFPHKHMGRTFRFGPKPELTSSDKGAGLYAGSHMFVASPPPSSVPLPDFLKTVTTTSEATSDLRRILGLFA